MAAITFPDNRKLYTVYYGGRILTNQIDAAKSAKIDLSKVPFITLPNGTNSNANFYCLVLKHRRTADMKAFLRPVPFLTTTPPSYMPMFPSLGTSYGGLISQTPLDTFREELMQFYKQKFVDQAIHDY